jgi:hypothetical protein
MLLLGALYFMGEVSSSNMALQNKQVGNNKLFFKTCNTIQRKPMQGTKRQVKKGIQTKLNWRYILSIL